VGAATGSIALIAAAVFCAGDTLFVGVAVLSAAKVNSATAEPIPPSHHHALFDFFCGFIRVTVKLLL
jgi:hypothetical protein